jgi:hypothetical protein
MHQLASSEEITSSRYEKKFAYATLVISLTLKPHSASRWEN